MPTPDSAAGVETAAACRFGLPVCGVPSGGGLPLSAVRRDSPEPARVKIATVAGWWLFAGR